MCFFFEEAAILETHGIDVQSPGGHSNSDEIDGNEFSEPGAEPGLGAVRTVLKDFTQHLQPPRPFSFNTEYKGEIEELKESRGLGFT